MSALSQQDQQQLQLAMEHLARIGNPCLTCWGLRAVPVRRQSGFGGITEVQACSSCGGTGVRRR